MSDNTKIEWTERSDWNPVRGCTRVSQGCVNCYAETIAGRFSGPGQPFHGFATRTPAGGRWTGKVEVMWDRLLLPLGWRKPALIFANSTSDIFHEALTEDEIAQIYAVAVAGHHLRGHTTQFLTKRPERARVLLNSDEFWWIVNATAGQLVMERTDPLDRRSDDARATLDDYGPGNPPPNVWLGTSVEDQAAADARIPHLLETPAAVRFLSCEPLLSDLDPSKWFYGQRFEGAGAGRDRDTFGGPAGHNLAAPGRGYSDHAAPSGYRAASDGQLPSPAIYVGRSEVSDRSAPNRLDDCERPDYSAGHRDQSSRRQQAEQRPVEPRTGDEEGERAAQLSRVGPASKGSARDKEHVVQAGRRESAGNSGALRHEGGDAADDRRTVQREPTHGFRNQPSENLDARPLIHWVIAGGESGPGARPMHPDWARSLRDQCADAGVPFLFKQWGDWADEADLGDDEPILRECRGRNDHRIRHLGSTTMVRVGKRVAGRLLDGVQHDGMPA